MPKATVAFPEDIGRTQVTLLALAANPTVDEKDAVILKAAANIAGELGARLLGEGPRLRVVE